jgi:cellulose synthase/poly-beta-1,6-N-acetylglucosamine synthase-like glycosyltransferase
MLIFIIIAVFLILLYGILIEYYRRAWNAIPDYTSEIPRPAAAPIGISVLIPARNEEANIRTCLDSLSAQSYPKDLYEVIVIDDHSTDRTRELIDECHYRDMHLICLPLGDPDGQPSAKPVSEGVTRAYKKIAIEIGLQLATGGLIVSTDADCQFHPDWLRTMADFHESTGAKFIAAPVKIDAGSSLLSIFQTLDFIVLQGITGAAVYKRFHTMCNGANLAYEKKIFHEVEGFRDIDDIPSGDDMLLMYKIYEKYPGQVRYLKNPRAIVLTKEAVSWTVFVNQRIRWASKANRYDDKRIFWILLLVYLVNLIFPALLLASFWNSRYFLVVIMLVLAKALIEYPFVLSVAAFFDQQRLMLWFLLLQPFHILYTIGIGWLGQFGSYRWKDRKI